MLNVFKEYKVLQILFDWFLKRKYMMLYCSLENFQMKLFCSEKICLKIFNGWLNPTKKFSTNLCLFDTTYQAVDEEQKPFGSGKPFFF